MKLERILITSEGLSFDIRSNNSPSPSRDAGVKHIKKMESNDGSYESSRKDLSNEMSCDLLSFLQECGGKTHSKILNGKESSDSSFE